MGDSGADRHELSLHAVSGRKIAFGALVGGVASIAKVVLQLILLPLMAKLLAPTEFGLYALALPTVTFATMLADGGLGTSLAREPESSTLVWSTAFWVLLAAGFALAVGVTAWGFLLAEMTHQPRLPGLIGLMSISLILLTVTVTPAARLTRRGRLAAGALADLTASLLGAAVAITLAIRGAGALSLAAQYLTGFGVRAAWFNALAFSKPRLEFRFASLGSHLATGGSIIGQKLVDLTERIAGNSLFGMSLGLGSLGYYTFSLQVSRFLAESVGNPIWSALYVRALRGDREHTVRIYCQLSRVLGIVLLPGSLIVAVAAPQLVTLLLGAQWLPAIVVLRVLVPSYAILTVLNQVSPLLLAFGRNDLLFWSSAAATGLRLVAIATGPWIGLQGIAWGVAAANVFYSVMLLTLSGRAVASHPMDMLTGLFGPVLSGMAALGTYLAVVQMMASGLVSMMASGLVAATAALAVLVLIDRQRLLTDIGALRKLVKRPAS